MVLTVAPPAAKAAVKGAETISSMRKRESPRRIEK